ncbi:hypothetical protein DVH24_021875 [Malus domestica]|uniref:Uncharacterized protein n=1 Tax=Malus domestica TaxID=3750 RepID=A0A498IY34_MALDO|nr:hypothetical protein DVH24_021875 [Malus domestica]
MVEINKLAFPEDEEGSRVFRQLKAYCFELLASPKPQEALLCSLVSAPFSSPVSASCSPAILRVSLYMLACIVESVSHCSTVNGGFNIKVPSDPHPRKHSFITYACRTNLTSKKLGSEEKLVTHKVLKMPHKVSDSVAECCFSAWKNCSRILKKLTYGALLSPSDASEEFREGIFKCFGELLLNLLPCFDDSCACKQIFGVLMLLEYRDMKAPLSRT